MEFIPIIDEAVLHSTDFVDYERHFGNESVGERCTQRLALQLAERLSAGRESLEGDPEYSS